MAIDDQTLPARCVGKVPAAYILKHDSSGLFYLGSSGDVRQRVLRHHSLLAANRHYSEKLQEAYREDDKLSVEVFIAEDKSKAFALEQQLLNERHGEPLCVNRAKDAKASGRDLEISAEAREKMRLAKLGGKQTPEHIEKSRLAKAGKPASPALATHLAKVQEKRKVAISVGGHSYASLTEASKDLGVSLTAVYQRVQSASDQFKDWKKI